MEDQNSSVFGLKIDPNSQSHLADGAKWAKFLAIIGFVMCGLIALLGVFFSSIFSTLSNRYNEFGNDRAYATGAGIGAAIVYVGIAVLYFFPSLFLYRYADKMKKALATNDQDELNSSFQNLKIMFRYVGILTIILLAFYTIAFLILLSTKISAVG
jgi:hypothetical protein